MTTPQSFIFSISYSTHNKRCVVRKSRHCAHLIKKYQNFLLYYMRAYNPTLQGYKWQ